MTTGEHPTVRTILLIEDEPAIREVVQQAVGGRGDRWLCASTGADGIRLALANHPDLVLLDLGLPDVDGLEVCRRLRAHGLAAPLIVLSARHAEHEKVALLSAGADDYVTKPFGPDELRARVHAHLRRVAQRAVTGSVLRVGALTVDLEGRTVQRDGAPVHLTPTEWSLLAALAANAGRTLTHQQLFATVWGEATHGQAQQYVRVYVTHLRKKIERVPYEPKLIVTEPGVGYRFVVDGVA